MPLMTWKAPAPRSSRHKPIRGQGPAAAVRMPGKTITRPAPVRRSAAAFRDEWQRALAEKQAKEQARKSREVADAYDRHLETRG